LPVFFYAAIMPFFAASRQEIFFIISDTMKPVKARQSQFVIAASADRIHELFTDSTGLKVWPAYRLITHR